ncbi:SipW-dependent-type signal peptide-containing protein [Pseudarthrobacter sp. PS3-L1]|uniref:SipW-dependent-type signal peptide-containing protein n=1 Tax=Pseudarthrobacter sp. PS3-L1 TaxID=3046207 RepID=UPI0024B879EC|nr:SipW-dependent-type signal peptide-containing protein [Pseudarthrobacter sp. PS3-L1]MDJ0319964.1 SipW-dependent-type signal peptide-containing protein [Pseudarthrobacter sp. PS3-L1]
MSVSISTSANKRSRNRKAKAILAGGLVLGIGASIVLAAWNDSEFVTGTFSAGHFAVQGSTDGTAFADHAAAADAATLTFSTGFDKMSPSQTVAAPYALHLDKDTVNDATVSVATASGTGTASSLLTYGIIAVDSVAACTSTATGTATIVPTGTALTAVAGAAPFGLTKPITPGTIPGANAFLCLQVTSSALLVQGTSAVVTWEFRAESLP